jgi:trafficking protein particle complex subunit 11
MTKICSLISMSCCSPQRMKAVRATLFNLLCLNLIFAPVNHITLGDDSSTSLIKGVSFGIVEPGGVVKRTLYLHSTGTGGDRILDLSIQSHTIQPESSNMSPNTNETLRTLVVHTVPAMKPSFTVTYTRDPEPLPALLDLSKYEPDAVEGQSMATMTVAVISSGPWEVVVDSIRYKPEVGASSWCRWPCS